MPQRELSTCVWGTRVPECLVVLTYSGPLGSPVPSQHSESGFSRAQRDFFFFFLVPSLISHLGKPPHLLIINLPLRDPRSLASECRVSGFDLSGTLPSGKEHQEGCVSSLVHSNLETVPLQMAVSAGRGAARVGLPSCQQSTCVESILHLFGTPRCWVLFLVLPPRKEQPSLLEKK